jgi:uncharacterized metal-binding protein
MVLIILLLADLSMADGKTHERLTLKTLPLAIFLGGIAACGGHDVALTRWLWFFGPVALLLVVTGNETALTSAWPALFWAFTGNCLSDLVHIIADAV